MHRYNILCLDAHPCSSHFPEIGGQSGVAGYIDETIVTRQTKAKHFENLRHVHEVLGNYGLKLDNCVFFAAEVAYLGYIISNDGLRASDERVQAIL